MVEIRKVIASACSKVLISGAYLIIDPENEGMVFATSAKMYCTITQEIDPQITLQSP
jgi:phosphomevalonate kinase